MLPDLPLSCSGDHHHRRSKRLLETGVSWLDIDGSNGQRPTLGLDLGALVELKVTLEEIGLVCVCDGHCGYLWV
jgi:hypothetical protein